MNPRLRYLGVKLVEAETMTRGEYNDYRGWQIPSDENPDDAGYLVVYPDGYESWCPKKQFEEANRPISDMTFGHAIEASKKGFKIARRGWNGKNMWVALMDGMKLPPFNSQEPGKKVNDRTAKFIGEGTTLVTLPYFAMWTADEEWQPGWLASQTDMLSDDWMIVE